MASCLHKTVSCEKLQLVEEQCLNRNVDFYQIIMCEY